MSRVVALLLLFLALSATGCAEKKRTRPLPITQDAAAAPASAAASVTSPVPPPPQPTTSPSPPLLGITRHPIVLVHGIAGWAQVGRWAYFYGVPQRLRGLRQEVLVVQLNPLHSILVRAGELAHQIQTAYPDPLVRVNIIAHSMGGLDARAAIVHYGLAPRVASLTTICTPHRGSAVADVAVGRLSGNVQQSIDLLLNRVGLDWSAVIDLTSDHLRLSFNPATPDDGRVYYQSYAARSDPFNLAGNRMQAFLWPGWFISVAHGGDNDGLVSVDSARWGAYRGELPTDHGGAVGQLPGKSPFDHLRFYEDLARDLYRMGF